MPRSHVREHGQLWGGVLPVALEVRESERHCGYEGEELVDVAGVCDDARGLQDEVAMENLAACGGAGGFVVAVERAGEVEVR
jgi:hypothetical protein